MEAAGRVLAKPLRASTAVPPFARAAMDGFAVRARDTFGAAPTNPLALRVTGESRVGRVPERRVVLGCCHRIATGAPMPRGADAVVMFEHCRELRGGLVEVEVAATPSENVGAKGEDVRAGEVLLGAGNDLLAHDIAIAAALGLRRLSVARRPRVGVLSTGNELQRPGRRLRAGEIHDANRPGALAAVALAGGAAVDLGIARDTLGAVRSRIAAGLRRCDAVVVSGGSSAGARDFAPEAVASLGRPGVLIHGVAMRPGYPVGLGAVGRKPVVLLPGSPVAAALCVEEFVLPALRKMLGTGEKRLPRGALVRARAARRIPGAPGLTTFARVVLVERRGGLAADPLRTSGSGILSSLVRGSGLVVIPSSKEGIEEGEEVTVRLLRPRASGPDWDGGG